MVLYDPLCWDALLCCFGQGSSGFSNVWNNELLQLGTIAPDHFCCYWCSTFVCSYMMHAGFLNVMFEHVKSICNSVLLRSLIFVAHPFSSALIFATVNDMATEHANTALEKPKRWEPARALFLKTLLQSQTKDAFVAKQFFFSIRNHLFSTMAVPCVKLCLTMHYGKFTASIHRGVTFTQGQL